MDRKKWMAFGVAGAVGITVLGGAAAATAANLSLRSTDGAVVPGGPVTGPGGGVLDRTGLQLRVNGSSVSVVSSASATSAASSASSVTVVSAPSPVPPPAPAPAPPAVDSPDSPWSGGSVASAWSD